MEINFRHLTFSVKEDRVFLTRFGDIESSNETNFVEINVAGSFRRTHMGVKMGLSSEWNKLKYVSHELSGKKLSVVQESELVRVKSVFEGYDSTNTIRVHNEVTNIAKEDIVLEEVSSFVLSGIGGKGLFKTDHLYFTDFLQSHHTECQPRRASFADRGLFEVEVPAHSPSQRKISFANVGSWSTKEELPQGIIEDTDAKSALMFQIESNASWYYEISDRVGELYLYLGGGNYPYTGWAKKLLPNEKYTTYNVAVSLGGSVNDVISEMTSYRREICGLAEIDKSLPSIFNEYMHYSWDSPTEENTKKLAPVVAKAGVEYYVIDCGWHNEEPGDIIYPYVGQWKESKARFPKGVREITDYIRSLGMKPGLWIEPEVVGIKCQEMIDYYDDDCFVQRFGKRLSVSNRYFLDYRNKKVRDYMTETIRRMVEDYGAEYIKFDYNQDMGIGNDYMAFTPGEGLEACAEAFADWCREMVERFPNVVFEKCASGGLRMDYKSLSIFSLASTSDQTKYKLYPYVAGNILAAVIPEQAAVWSYPVGECEKVEDVTDRRIIVNMVNCLVGRVHLASHLERLDERQLQMVTDGIEVYNKIAKDKIGSSPYFPKGFARMGDKSVASGFRKGDKTYLAVWALKDDNKVVVPFDKKINKATVLYPYTKDKNCEVSFSENELTVTFKEIENAVFLLVE